MSIWLSGAARSPECARNGMCWSGWFKKSVGTSEMALKKAQDIATLNQLTARRECRIHHEVAVVRDVDSMLCWVRDVWSLMSLMLCSVALATTLKLEVHGRKAAKEKSPIGWGDGDRGRSSTLTKVEARWKYTFLFLVIILTIIIADMNC